MLIALFFFLVKVVIPQLSNLLVGFLVPIIILSGIVMIFGSVGMKISNNLGSTIVSGIFRAIGYLGRQIFKWIDRIARYTFKTTPKVYNECRRRTQSLKAPWSQILSILASFVFVAIII